MHSTTTSRMISMKRLLSLGLMALGSMLTVTAQAAAPGITGPTFKLQAKDAYITQPDGQSVYSWGYGCDETKAPSGYAPSAITGASCNDMQLPGPTLIVTEGDTVSVTLTNK